MLDDENDKRIKEAAEHYHPAYDDTAWEKMQQLLDEQLPQKKERKKIFFILPSLLLIAILIFFVVMNNGKKDSPSIAKNIPSKNNTEKSLTEKPVLNSKEKNSSKAEPIKTSLLPAGNKTKNNHVSIAAISRRNNKVPSNSTLQTKNEIPFSGNHLIVNEKELNQQSVSKTNNIDDTNKATSSLDLKPENVDKTDSITVTTKENNSVPKKATDEKNVSKNEIGKKTVSIKKSKKKNPAFANNFGIGISAGADISGVRANKIGKLTGIFGLGFNYSISKKIGIRSGFYISKKIYSVDGNDYDLPGGNPNYAYLENVNANCTVYEIPLKVDYNFKKIKNHNWFISTGLSSYLMKKENYNYYYKTLSGEAYEKDWTINNKNQHFFSVLSFSGGYQYFFNNQFSFAAEPYVNLPLKGVGVGKVKLNSGGILLTLKMKPFLKKGI